MPFVTVDDLRVLLLRIMDGAPLSFARRLFGSDADRVRTTWSSTDARARNWWEIPRVQERIRKLITGSSGLSVPEYVTTSFLPNGGCTALLLGSGSGTKAIAWAKTGYFDRIVGIDLSPKRVRIAQEAAASEGVQNIVRFVCQDFFESAFDEGSFDVIVAEAVLHHLAPASKALDRVNVLLREGGLLIVDEYVGPNRFQWSTAQVQYANAALRLLPVELRRYRQLRWTKQAIARHGTFTMRLYDPSEAADAASILPCIDERFSVIIRRDYGGTILHPVLKDLAHHFMSSDRLAIQGLETLFFIEDYLLRNRLLSSDFVFLVAQKTSPTRLRISSPETAPRQSNSN